MRAALNYFVFPTWRFLIAGHLRILQLRSGGHRQLHPVNCVDWDQASVYAKFKGGRLPSESEWEYAVTSSGKEQKYPWDK